MIVVFAIVTVSFGGYTAAKFKRIYLDPWPADAVRNSVFMRMSASNVKPFDVSQFINDNEISGNMFNYWTEGGAIAFGQCPDPETGSTPLQLFMDGRAQAAYNHDTFLLWRKIKAGGDSNYFGGLIRKYGSLNKLKRADYLTMAEYIEGQLTKAGVWVVLMPTSEVPYPGVSIKKINPDSKYYFVKALQLTGRWATVYIDDYQCLMVDMKTQQGKDMFDLAKTEKLIYPNEYIKNLTLANMYLRSRDVGLSSRGLKYAIKAFELKSGRSSAMKLRSEARAHAHLRKETDETLQKFLDDFLANHEALKKQDGYTDKLLAALISSEALGIDYAGSKPELAKKYRKFLEEHRNRPTELSLEAKW